MAISALIFRTPTDTYRVLKYKTGMRLKEGYAYTMSYFNSYVYPYRGEVDDYNEAILPGLYLVRKNVFMCMPITDDDKYLYDKSRVIELSPESIFMNLDSVTLDPILEREPIGDNDIFNPPIKGTDDIMLAGMKYAIGHKNISFNQYSHKFTDSATKNNGRRALTAGNSLRCEMAARFAEVFDLNLGILFWDKEGAPHPMDKEYSSVYAIFNDEPLDFNDPKYKFYRIEKD